MGCEHEGGGFYRPRQPKKTAFYQLACLPKPLPVRVPTQTGRRRQVEKFYPQFKAVYEERYQECYGFWRPAIAAAVEKFLECGDPPSLWRATAGRS